MFELVKVLKNKGLISEKEAHRIKERLTNKWLKSEYPDWVYFVEREKKERVYREEIREVFRILRDLYRESGKRSHDHDSKFSQQILNCLDKINLIEIHRNSHYICMKGEVDFKFYLKDDYYNEWNLFELKIFKSN